VLFRKVKKKAGREYYNLFIPSAVSFNGSSLIFSLSQRSGVAFTKLEKHLPSLVNLNEDPQLAEVLLYILQEGLSLTPVFILFLEAHEKQESFYVFMFNFLHNYSQRCFLTQFYS